MGAVPGVGLTAAQLKHIQAAKSKIIAGRTQLGVLVSQSNGPIALIAANALATPPAPAIQDGGAGGTFPGGNVYAQVVALSPSGQTIAGAEAGPVNIPANHKVNITPGAVANATSYRVYANAASGQEQYQGAVNPGNTLVISAPLATGQEAAPNLSYTLVNAILRHERGVNPQDLDETGAAGDRRLMQVLIEMDAALYTPGGIAAAIQATLFYVDCVIASPAAVNLPSTRKYEFIDFVSTGIPPGGDRLVGIMRRIQ